MRAIGEVLEGMDPPFGVKPGHALRAGMSAAVAAYRALLRGCDAEWRLELAVEAYRDRLVAGPEPQLWPHALRKAALQLARGEPFVGLSEGELGRPGDHWQPAPGTPVLVLPVVDWGGPLSAEPVRLVELLALDPADPARWWRLTGNVSWLGGSDAVAPFEDLGPVKLHEHPLDWANAGGEASGAACLLDPEGAEAGGARQILLGPRPLAVLGPRDAAAAYGRRLKRLQARLRPKLPKVLIEKGAAE